MRVAEPVPTANRLARQRWPELPAGPLVLVPTGSTEQHGPHLPFDTDTVIATAVADGIAEGLSRLPAAPQVLVAPALPYGASGEHQDFPGTASIGTEALRLVLVELVRSLRTWASRIVVVNGHGGNLAGLLGAIVQLRDEGHDVAWLACGLAEGDAHAGRTETALLLHLAPHAVRLDRAAPGNRDGIAQVLPRLRSEGVRAVSPSGVLGDPTGATAEEGVRLLTQLVDAGLAALRSGEVDRDGRLRPSRTTT